MFIASAPASVSAIARTSGDARQTLAFMRQMIDRAKVDPAIISAAHSIVALTPEHDARGELAAVFQWARDRLRYVRDVAGVETLSYPGLVLRRGTGDCDDQTALLCALFEAIGYPTRLVAARYESNAFEHVYCQVWDGAQWLDCEPIERSAALGQSYAGAREIWIEPR